MNEQSYLALFLYPDDAREPFSVRLPKLAPRPPALLRASSSFEGVQAVDVFRLADSSSWPEVAAYLYEGTVPGTLHDAGRVEQVLTPDD